jgi:hypothetical protein
MELQDHFHPLRFNLDFKRFLVEDRKIFFVGVETWRIGGGTVLQISDFGRRAEFSANLYSAECLMRYLGETVQILTRTSRGAGIRRGKRGESKLGEATLL